MKNTRIAIVGSGPSGFYAAEALLRQKDFPVAIDMFDRLPTPYGLVRGGVAPDHQKIKGVIAVYEKIASQPAFRFFGNVKLGKDIQIQDLKKHYDQIVYAVGNESDRKLGVPGEDLAGSHSATAFVGWYNGHPDYRKETFDLSQEAVAVIGIGNVAMDVTRILAEDPEHLAGTDIADYALQALRGSRVKTIHVLGRRGPAQAAFSPAEIQEIGELKSSDLVVKPEETVIDDLSKEDLTDINNKKNVDYVTQVSKRGEGSKPKKVRLRFLTSPVEIIGKDGRIISVKIEKNRLEKDSKGKVAARGAGQFETLPVGLVFRSVGYRGIPIPGVSFDEKSGRIPNAEGRVLDAKTGQKLPGEYVVGWAKRGPSGLIGTNRADSMATVNAMLADLKSGIKISAAALANKSQVQLSSNVVFEGDSNPDAIPTLLRERKIAFVTFEDWRQLDKIEVSRGKATGKIREKFTSIADMLAAIQSTKQAA